MSKIKKKIFNLFLILIIGGIGGILADQFFLPYLSTIPVFSKISFIHQAGNGTTIINPTEKITITENTAIEQAIDKISPCLVSIQAYKNKKLLSQGTGFIVTSDGLIITTADLVPANADKYLVFRNNHSLVAKVIKVDLENNLALLQVEETNLSVVSFIDLDDLKLDKEIGLANGSSLVNVKGEVIGLNLIDKDGFIEVISVDIIKEFIGL